MVHDNWMTASCNTLGVDLSSPNFFMYRNALLHPVRLLTGFVLLGLLSCYPLSFVMPARMGWENGAVENIQVVVLLIGLMLAIAYAARTVDRVEHRFWLMVAPFWLIFIGRELSWGAVFLKPIHINEEGPGFSSSLLWYKPAVYPFLGLLLAVSAYLILRHRLWRVIWKLIRNGQFPLLQLGLSVIAILVSTNTEGHGWHDFNLPKPQLQVMEELVEVAAYVSLLAAQLRIRYGMGLIKR
ncbi:hypothetical protein FXN63_17890 [Pigmentiphaga aceris]|uniref:Uncharacterized protein n=1 Tax=Pigmentiphaga aceris TaxID=1940612 RepID=A0A5C0B2T3_9BURK|nr:hypothetical protein [Pigmentiphaga aceris]QEI07500.1 hypothetical protein FXN63_17890 [Pigmentiphaga aceris]